MLRLWIGRALLWLLLPAQIEQAKRRPGVPLAHVGWKLKVETTAGVPAGHPRSQAADRR
jgi:hypothetical protein